MIALAGGWSKFRAGGKRDLEEWRIRESYWLFVLGWKSVTSTSIRFSKHEFMLLFCVAGFVQLAAEALGFTFTSDGFFRPGLGQFGLLGGGQLFGVSRAH